MGYILWFEQITKDSIPLAGGKGANLGEMFNLKLPVPPGFAITTKAFNKFLEVNKLGNQIDQIISSTDVEETDALMQASATIKKMIEGAEYPMSMKSELIEAYRNLSYNDVSVPQAIELISAGRDFTLVAVRSSATAEDLPTASFAGQQATFLNVKGVKNYLDSVRKAWASLFEPRAIFYRNKQNFQNASISIIVQKMVNSEKSGVMFTANPATGEDNIMIESTWGLGETLVSGEIQPDNFIVSKDGKLLSKFIGTKDKMRIRDVATDRTVVLPVTPEKQKQQTLSEDEILTLAKYGIKLEQHYGKPQDIEFAIEKGRIYIVQTRAITTLGKHFEKEEVAGEPILKGLGSSPGIATGIVRIIKSMQDLGKVQKGDVIVTKMTSPDMVVAMARSVAIVTDEGGVTAHASIVGREMGLPVIVGTINATKVLQDGQKITVDAYKGFVYPGEVELEKPHEEIQATEDHAGELMKELTATSIKVNLVFARNLESISKKADGVGLLRIEHMITESGVHPAKLVREGRKEDYIKILMDGIRPIAQAFSPKPVWVRNLDARSDEFRNLDGGSEEPQEANPMLGWHGIRRSLDEPELLKAEFEAIKRLHEEGLKNVHIMIPFVIHVDEFIKAKNIAKEVGLPQEVKLGIMVETPGAAMTIEDFCKAGIEFISFGSNDLTQMTLGIDRNNAKIAGLYSELHPAVRKMMKYVIKVCHSYRVETSICGEGPSNLPELVEYLVTVGIDSISAEMDAIDEVRQTVIKTERKLLLEAFRNKR